MLPTTCGIESFGANTDSAEVAGASEGSNGLVGPADCRDNPGLQSHRPQPMAADGTGDIVREATRRA
jgi:hypothetical protein